MNYLFTCVKPRNLALDQHDGMEEGRHGNMSLEKNCPGIENVWHLIRWGPHCLNHIPGMVSDLWKTGTINALHLVLKIDEFKVKEPTGEKY